jgi:hypothetical protein
MSVLDFLYLSYMSYVCLICTLIPQWNQEGAPRSESGGSGRYKMFRMKDPRQALQTLSQARSLSRELVLGAISWAFIAKNIKIFKN